VRAARLFNAGVRNGKSSATTHRFLVALFFLIVLPGVALPQASPLSDRRQNEPSTIRVSVGLVVLHVTVKDHRGNIASGLDQGNFRVYENGVLQQITYFSHSDIPVTVGLVIDNSGSMGPKRSEVIVAGLAFARSSNPQDQMFVVNFNEHVRFALPDNTPFTDQPSQLHVALSSVKADGETALYDAIAAALEHLKIGDRNKKALIVISDGGDNASQHTLAQVIAAARRSDAIIYTLDISDQNDPDNKPRILQQLAKDTGGEAFQPNSLSEVVPICQQIALDIRTQYTIAYVPTNRRQDGTYRTIQVKASAPGRGRLFVRTRTGYTAPLKPPTISGNRSERP
jgi:Ca-activated chloride channel family protein